MKNIFFNAHHSPIGAFATFTLGHPGASGGFGVELAKPADHDVYIGLESADGDVFELLPFCNERVAGAERERYEVDGHKPVDSRVRIVSFPRESISRDFQVGSDTWRAGDLEFTIHTPMTGVPDPETAAEDDLRFALVPAVAVEFTVDNRACGRTRRAVFGFKGADPYSGMRNAVDEALGVHGVGQGRHVAILTDEHDVRSGLGFELSDVLRPKHPEDLDFGLGICGAMVFDVPAGVVRTCRFVVSFYRDGLMTSGLDSRYFYTRLYKGVEDAGAYALAHFDALTEAARQASDTIDKSRLTEDQRFMLAHAIHSYYGNTQMLEVDGRPVWVVNEGEYRMMNTFDLTVDQLFFEIKLNPWTVKNVLDLYVDRYSYRDEVRFPGEEGTHPGGISFTHDMGVANVFSREGYSSYERPGLHGCFSYMTHEQLVNWVLTAGCYLAQTGDWEWFRRRESVFTDCLQSLLNRDHPDVASRNGLMSLDSSRTKGGSEISTYDSLDASLGQARGNVYMGMKTWAAYVALEAIFEHAGEAGSAGTAADQAERCARTIVASAGVDGQLPAIIGEETDARIISAIEGLVMPYYMGLTEAISPDGRFGELVRAMAKHLRAVLVPGVCLFPDGGWKLSSTSDNSWLSKIYLAQFVAREILGIDSGDVTANADKAHVDWLLHAEYSYFAWSDQMVAGRAMASRYYPRGVTAILWMDEGGHDAKPEAKARTFAFRSRGNGTLDRSSHKAPRGGKVAGGLQ